MLDPYFEDNKTVNNTTKASATESPVAKYETEESFEFRPNQAQNLQNVRMRYLQRLAHEKVWLNQLQKPKQSQNLIVFDWDDTLFPTTHLHPVDEKEYTILIEKYQHQLRAIEERACKLIETCLKQAKVVIITNARKGWVEFSSKKFLPRLHIIIMKYVQIISARVDYEHLAPFDTF